MLELATEKTFRKIFSQAKDPIIVDIREGKDMVLAAKLKRDYRHLPELINRGITKVMLKRPLSGKMRLSGIVDKAKIFGREIILMHDSEEHAQTVKEIINELGYN